MKTDEMNIQEAAEKGTNMPGQQQDITTYKLLFKILKTKEDVAPVLSPFFAEKVAEKLETRAVAKVALAEYTWKIIAVILFMSCAGIAVALVDIETVILNSLSSIKWYIITGTILIAIIDLVDRKFVRKVI